MSTIYNQMDEATKRPQNAVADDILYYGWDTIIFKKNSDNEDYAYLKKSSLFNASDKKSDILKTNDFPMEGGRLAQIIGLSVTHNIVPENEANIVPFEIASYLTLNVDDVDYSHIPLKTLLTYNRVPLGKKERVDGFVNQFESRTDDPASPSANQVWFRSDLNKLYVRKGSVNVPVDFESQTRFEVLPKGGEWTKLLKPIEPPHQGKFKMNFEPVSNIKTASVEKYGHKFGAGIVDSIDSPVFFIQVMYVAQLIRAKTR